MLQVEKLIKEQRSKGVKVVKYIECSAREKKNVKNVFEEAMYIAFSGENPLHAAAWFGHKDKVKLLLRQGVNINDKNEKGKTPIHLAASGGHTDTVKLLIEHGANINEKDNDGKTAIHQAAEEGNSDRMKFLLSVGANINEKDNDGKTAIHQAAEEGNSDRMKFLLSVGADPYIADVKGRTVRDVLKDRWTEQWEERILSSATEENKVYISAALALNKDDFLMKVIKRVAEEKVETDGVVQKKLSELFFTRNGEDISNVLAFIGRNLKNNKLMLTLIGGEGENRFYLVKTKALGDEAGGRSLLKYIVDNGARMMKQREELLDLLKEKIENEESKIIHNLKFGLPSSIGLAECIKMTKEKYEWSKTKVRGMIVMSLITNILGLVLYFLDVFTDGLYVDKMLKHSLRNPEHFSALKTNCSNEFYREMMDNKWKMLCEQEREYCFELHQNLTLMGQDCRDFGLRFEDPQRFTECFWYSLIHCIVPIIWIILVFILTMNVWNIWAIPFPPITRIVKIYQDTQMFNKRSKWDFKEKVPEIEAKIADHEDSVKLSSSIEAATESSPQFFFQTVYFLPNLIINLVRSRGLEELVSYKMISIAFSFTSVAVSNYLIRFYTNLILTFQTMLSGIVIRRELLLELVPLYY